MLPNITKQDLKWISTNVLVAFCIAQAIALVVITKHYWDKDDRESANKDEIIKIYREANLRAAEIEKQSRILKELK